MFLITDLYDIIGLYTNFDTYKKLIEIYPNIFTFPKLIKNTKLQIKNWLKYIKVDYNIDLLNEKDLYRLSELFLNRRKDNNFNLYFFNQKPGVFNNVKDIFFVKTYKCECKSLSEERIENYENLDLIENLDPEQLDDLEQSARLEIDFTKLRRGDLVNFTLFGTRYNEGHMIYNGNNLELLEKNEYNEYMIPSNYYVQDFPHIQYFNTEKDLHLKKSGENLTFIKVYQTYIDDQLDAIYKLYKFKTDDNYIIYTVKDFRNTEDYKKYYEYDYQNFLYEYKEYLYVFENEDFRKNLEAEILDDYKNYNSVLCQLEELE